MAKPAWVAALFAALLAGCAESGDTIMPEPTSGGIQGLLIDDRFRPIVAGTVLLEPLGLVTQSAQDGIFAFRDVPPGAYTLKVSADGHEASPYPVDVAAGAFAEAHVVARRTVNDGTTIHAQEFLLFVECAFAAGVVSSSGGCSGDMSEDGGGPSFIVDYTGIANATWMVVEMRTDRPASPETGAYHVSIGFDIDGDGIGDGTHADVVLHDGEHISVHMQHNTSLLGDDGEPFDAWRNQYPVRVILFPLGQYQNEGQEVADEACGAAGGPACPMKWRGTGYQAAVRAQFVVSVFDGPPESDPTSYCVLC